MIQGKVYPLIVCVILWAVGFCVQAKPVLVLFPVEVGKADAEMAADYGAALQDGLQSRYQVFYGPAVEAELEKEYQKIELVIFG